MVSDITINKVLWRNNEKGRVQVHFLKSGMKFFHLLPMEKPLDFTLVALSPFPQSTY